MLLRNLNSSNGQCNGTRAIIRGKINYNSVSNKKYSILKLNK